jgi:hypothetical protein
LTASVPRDALRCKASYSAGPYLHTNLRSSCWPTERHATIMTMPLPHDHPQLGARE